MTRLAATLLVLALLSPHAARANSLDIPIKGYGVSLGNSPRFTGVRISFVDSSVERINGLNLTLWVPRANYDAVYNGVSVGLLAITAKTLNGVHVAGFGLGGQKLRGFGAGVIGLGMEDIHGVAVGGLGIGTQVVRGLGVALVGIGSTDFVGMGVAGLGMGGQRHAGIFVAGLGMGGTDMHGLFVSGVGMGGESFRGVGIAGIGMGADSMKGFFLGGAGLGAQEITGFGGGLIGIGATRMKGLFAGALVRVTDDLPEGLAHLTGVSIAAVNLNNGIHEGLAIGLINIAEELHGVQIGLINIAKNNPSGLKVLPLINAHF